MNRTIDNINPTKRGAKREPSSQGAQRPAAWRRPPSFVRRTSSVRRHGGRSLHPALRRDREQSTNPSPRCFDRNGCRRTVAAAYGAARVRCCGPSDRERYRIRVEKLLPLARPLCEQARCARGGLLASGVGSARDRRLQVTDAPWLGRMGVASRSIEHQDVISKRDFRALGCIGRPLRFRVSLCIAREHRSPLHAVQLQLDGCRRIAEPIAHRVREPIPLAPRRSPDARGYGARQSCPHRVELHITRDSEQCRVIKHPRRQKSPLPEVTSDPVLAVPCSGARLLEQTVKEAEAGEIPAGSPQEPWRTDEPAKLGLRWRAFGRDAGSLAEFAIRQERKPALSDLAIGPVAYDVGANSQQQVKVVVHDSE